MINFSAVAEASLPDGKKATKIEAGGKVIWQEAPQDIYYYVSLGDSITFGTGIYSDTNDVYNDKYQYGTKYNTSNDSLILENSYTDLIAKKLKSIHGQDKVSAVSFARVGDYVSDLLEKLTHDVVKNAIKRANLVTIAIGANDVLRPAMSLLDDYIWGDGNAMFAEVERRLAIICDPDNPNSYMSLVKALYAINPTATYIFTNQYVPHKYAYFEMSTADQNYLNGTLGPLMWAIPSELEGLRGSFMATSVVRMIESKMNNVYPLSSGWIDRLNKALTNAINTLNKSNFVIVDTKGVFESVPDRIVDAPLHYNDLVNVEITKGYTCEDLDWGMFWMGIGTDALFGNIENIADSVMKNVYNEVLAPAMDPHPKAAGHSALMNSFGDALGWGTVDRATITYRDSNNYFRSYQYTCLGMTGVPAYVTTPTANDVSGIFDTPDAAHLEGWSTEQNGGGAFYKIGEAVQVPSTGITLFTSWSKTCTLTYKAILGDSLPSYDSSDSGPMECYAMAVGQYNIDNSIVEQKFEHFSDPEVSKAYPYGTRIKVAVAVESGGGRSYITVNDSQVAGSGSFVTHEFDLTSDTTVIFEWNNWMEGSIFSGITYVSYWNCYITTSN